MQPEGFRNTTFDNQAVFQNLVAEVQTREMQRSRQVTLGNFLTDFLLHPLSDEISKKDQKICLIASVALVIFTAGTLHLGVAVYNWGVRNVDDQTETSNFTHLRNRLNELIRQFLPG